MQLSIIGIDLGKTSCSLVAWMLAAKSSYVGACIATPSSSSAPSTRPVSLLWRRAAVRTTSAVL